MEEIWYESIVLVSMKCQGVFSECRHSSCSSWLWNTYDWIEYIFKRIIMNYKWNSSVHRFTLLCVQIHPDMIWKSISHPSYDVQCNNVICIHSRHEWLFRWTKTEYWQVPMLSIYIYIYNILVSIFLPVVIIHQSPWILCFSCNDDVQISIFWYLNKTLTN